MVLHLLNLFQKYSDILIFKLSEFIMNKLSSETLDLLNMSQSRSEVKLGNKEIKDRRESLERFLKKKDDKPRK